MAPVVTETGSGDSSGGSVETTTETQDAPPSGDSSSTTSDSGGAGVVTGGDNCLDAIFSSVGEIPNGHGGFSDPGYVSPNSPSNASF